MTFTSSIPSVETVPEIFVTSETPAHPARAATAHAVRKNLFININIKNHAAPYNGDTFYKDTQKTGAMQVYLQLPPMLHFGVESTNCRRWKQGIIVHGGTRLWPDICKTGNGNGLLFHHSHFLIFSAGQIRPEVFSPDGQTSTACFPCGHGLRPCGRSGGGHRVHRGPVRRVKPVRCLRLLLR